MMTRLRRHRPASLLLVAPATMALLCAAPPADARPAGPRMIADAHPARPHMIADARPAGPQMIAVGQTAENPTRCQAGSPGPYDAVQAATAARPGYAVPAPGVLTAWSTRAGADGGLMQLQVWRRTATPDRYTLVAASPPGRLTAGRLNAFPLRPVIRVQGGDLLGFRQLSPLLGCGESTADPGDVWATNHAGGPAPRRGTSEILTQQADLRINVAATLRVTGRRGR